MSQLSVLNDGFVGCLKSNSELCELHIYHQHQFKVIAFVKNNKRHVTSCIFTSTKVNTFVINNKWHIGDYKLCIPNAKVNTFVTNMLINNNGHVINCNVYPPIPRSINITTNKWHVCCYKYCIFTATKEKCKQAYTLKTSS